MIDIGANLANEQFKNDLKEVIERSLSSNVKGLILTSTDWKSYQENISIIEKYNSIIPIKTTYGLHPHNASNSKQIIDNLDTELNNQSICALGEFGLDYFRMISPQNVQLNIMEKFLDTAIKYPHLGLFLHERDAFDDFYSILKNSQANNKSVVHCFTGTLEQAKQYLDIGCYIGITGWISDKRRNHDVKEALKYIPLERLMIETDCPYLTPFNIPNKPRRNEPSFLSYVAKSVSEIKNLPLEDVILKTTQNSLDFFSFNDYNNSNYQVKIK